MNQTFFMKFVKIHVGGRKYKFSLVIQRGQILSLFIKSFWLKERSIPTPRWREKGWRWSPKDANKSDFGSFLVDWTNIPCNDRFDSSLNYNLVTCNLMTFIVISELTITVEVDWGSMSLYFNWCWFGQCGKWCKLNHWLVSFGSFWSFCKNGLLVVFYTQFQRISFLRKMIQHE